MHLELPSDRNGGQHSLVTDLGVVHVEKLPDSRDALQFLFGRLIAASVQGYVLGAG